MAIVDNREQLEQLNNEMTKAAGMYREFGKQIEESGGPPALVGQCRNVAHHLEQASKGVADIYNTLATMLGMAKAVEKMSFMRDLLNGDKK